ncbi:MAG TPA: CRISPR system precrRNA processing endoribonuclease RAMP protein Cas6, partial [Nevskiaceae bacterium]
TSLHLDTVHLRGPEPVALDPDDAHAVASLHLFTPVVPAPPGSATLRFDHPLRLRRDNRYLRPDEFDFATFFTTLVRRASMLATLSGTALPDDDYAALAEGARSIRVEDTDLRWRDWSRRSARQQRRIPMGGMVGAITVSGSLERLWPWLWVGQWLHVGKGAVMGAGHYTITAPCAGDLPTRLFANDPGHAVPLHKLSTGPNRASPKIA